MDPSNQILKSINLRNQDYSCGFLTKLPLTGKNRYFKTFLFDKRLVLKSNVCSPMIEAWIFLSKFVSTTKT